MHLGIVGISGLVGRKILESLDILNIQFDKLSLYGSSDNNNIIFRNNNYPVKKFLNSYLYELDYCILAVDNPIARDIIEYEKEFDISCIIIDNSSEYRLDSNVPLIIPEINMSDYENQKIIANPNCSTTILLMLLYPLTTLCEIKRVVVTTYQASSGAGKKGLEELILQTKEISSNAPLTTYYWGKQYIHNIFSHNSSIDRETRYNKEELKIINETAKILHNDKIIINPTCVRVPIFQSHCISVNVEFENPVEREDIINKLSNFPGVVIEDNIETNEFPEPVKTTNKTDIMIGRIRHTIEDKKIYEFFISGDQLLKGAAYNSVQILKELIILS